MKSRILLAVAVAGLSLPALANDYTNRADNRNDYNSRTGMSRSADYNNHYTSNRAYRDNYDRTYYQNQANLKASFDAADKDRNGYLNRSEQTAFFNSLDRDNNGVLSVAEQRALGQKAGRIDRNRDEQISLFELNRDFDLSENSQHAWGYDNNAPDNQRPARN